MPSTVFCLHRVAPTNTGDIASAPTLWVPELIGADHIDAIDGDLTHMLGIARERPVTVVVGGGGLFGNGWFAKSLAQLGAALGEIDSLEAVIWGAGLNTHYDRSVEDLPTGLFSRAAAVGLRDRGTPWPWVPCASVLHPAFLSPSEPVHDVVVYTHQRSRALRDQARAAGLPLRENRGPEVGDAIRFLASGATVVTDTYHGAYWAALLGRRVAVVSAFSTKFDEFCWPVPITREGSLTEALISARRFPAAYHEAISVTDDMNRRVLEIVAR